VRLCGDLLLIYTLNAHVLPRYLAWVVLWACGIVGYFLSMLAPKENVRATGVGEAEPHIRTDEERGVNGASASPASTSTLIEAEN
jgi:hypothetical protein